ncbi:vWA domain-containing protein [Chitinophaga sp.]|uniref:vWA domain-containing protein n=1 Tax=Chitinophaga sp. TaxID=1869181 RepID=UPI002D8054E9|nr:VWA domain-containing protein [Chitinophaga sp.]
MHQTCEIKKRGIQQRSAPQLVIMIDSSASMAADQQISLVKGLITGILQRYRHQKPRVAMIALSGGSAEIITPFTGNIQLLISALTDLRTGGKTNMLAGFRKAAALLQQQKDNSAQHLYLFTDGRINAGDTPRPMEDAAEFYRTHLSGFKRNTFIINTETGYPRLGMAVTLAERLDCRMFEPEQ